MDGKELRNLRHKAGISLRKASRETKILIARYVEIERTGEATTREMNAIKKLLGAA
jgi:transcriptional regulator with XRE-family HTH domain